jgi:hypothetical protein
VPTVMQWTLHLLSKIEEQCRYAALFEKRYCNEYVLPFILKEYREVYGSAVDQVLPILDPPKTGTAAVVIDALVERLTLLGAGSDDARVAKLIQEAWEDNDLDVMHREAHREALIKARSFGQVHRSTDGRAIVGIESPEQMAVHRQSAPPYDVDASLKITVDEWTGQRRGLLRLPGRDIRLIEGIALVNDPEEPEARSSRWVVDTASEGGGETDTRLPMVPDVEFSRQARLIKAPVSEIEPIASLVDISDLIEGLLVFAGHFGAVPIHFATGLTVPRDPKDPSGKTPLLGPDGKPVIPFRPRADHFWADTNPDARFGQLQPADLASFVTWAEHVGGRIRAKTSVASTYFSLDLKSHMSAELLKTDEAPMVRRVLSMGRDGTFGQSWRRLQRYMLMFEEPATQARVKPRWADPETRVEAQATDSFQKVVASGLGIAAAAEKILGWDPELVARAVAEGEAAQARMEAVKREGDQSLERLARDLIPVPELAAA